MEEFYQMNILKVDHFSSSRSKNLFNHCKEKIFLLEQNKEINNKENSEENDKIKVTPQKSKRTKRKSFVFTITKKLTGLFEKKIKKKIIKMENETQENNKISGGSFEDVSNFNDKNYIPKFDSDILCKDRIVLLLKISFAEILRYILELYSMEIHSLLCPYFLSKFQTKQLKRICFEYYIDSIMLSKSIFVGISPISISIELSFCIFIYEVLQDKFRGKDRIKKLYMNSLKDLKRYI